jgi:hypothetical protein
MDFHNIFPYTPLALSMPVFVAGLRAFHVQVRGIQVRVSHN